MVTRKKDIIEKTLNTVEGGRENSAVIEALGMRLMDRFYVNKLLRREKEKEWIKNLRQHKGIYDPDVQARFEKNSSRVYPKITRSKDNLVLSKLHEMLFPSGDRNWSIEPTPVPNIPKAIAEQIYMSMMMADETGAVIPPAQKDVDAAIHEYVKLCCADMQKEMDDQFTEMRYNYKVGKPALRSGVILGTGLVKGPLVEKRRATRWEFGAGIQDITRSTSDADAPYFSFVPIWNWYPDMTVTEKEDMEGCFERHIYTKHQLRLLMQLKGFNKRAISDYIRANPDGDYKPEPWELDIRTLTREVASEAQRDRTESGDYIDLTGEGLYSSAGAKYVVQEYWGYIDGREIAACGGTVKDGELDTEVTALVWLLGGKPIKAVKNPNPAQNDPYHIFYYEKDETSIFGEGLPSIIKHSQMSIASASRMLLNNAAICCLTGDTIVYRNQKSERNGTRPSAISLLDLWNSRGEKNGGLRRTKIRSVNESTGEIFFNRIADIFDNGIAPVFEIQTVRGYSIRATDTHRFLCDSGDWQALSDFCVGDLIAVNGSATVLPLPCIDCGQPKKTRIGLRCRACASKKENSTWNSAQAELASTNTEALNSTARQRWACQKDKKDRCERCGVHRETGSRLDIHHIDRNPHNNEPSNKLTLCCYCHRFVHKRFDHVGDAFKHRFVDFDEIASIEYVGEERVFDLQMEGPNHNFIANGLVSHNSGPQFEVNLNLIDTDMTAIDDLRPLKIWVRTGQGAEANFPALRIYNVNSYINDYLAVINQFQTFGDIESTLPTWMIAEPTKAGNETVGAMSMKMGTITVSLRDIVRNFDDFTEGVVDALYQWNMAFNPKRDIKGDYKIKTHGSTFLVLREVRMNALNQFVATLGPEDWAYIPRRQIIEERLKANEIDLELRTEEQAQQYIASLQDMELKKLQYEDLKADIQKKRAMALNLATKGQKTATETRLPAPVMDTIIETKKATRAGENGGSTEGRDNQGVL